MNGTQQPSTAPLHVIDARDHAAVALRDLQPGEEITVGEMTLTIRTAVPRGHKVAVKAVAAGEAVYKYGWPIGHATQDIPQGAHIHSHNLKTSLSGLEDYSYTPEAPIIADAVQPPATFMGYRRANGRVGTRNEIWILCTVGCVARTADRVAAAASKDLPPGVDGVYAFTHPFGCSQLGDDLDNTRRVIGALAAHPNAGGVLILGLGCESNQMDALLAAAPDIDRTRLKVFNTQTSDDEIEDGLAAVQALAAIAGQDHRVPCPVSDLVLGVKCGGSDGFSGLTANPLVGRIADRVAEAGGTPIITEIPEIFGAERVLLARSKTKAVFDQMVGVVDRFKRYFLDHGMPIYENPSPGNIAGGITTLEEKSLGAVQKAGHSPLRQVLNYGERVDEHGLALLEAPGNDAVSSTALTAAGATVILFTTGRGTPLGFPTPTLKIATNSALAARKPHWIDFNAGTTVEGESMDSASDALFTLVLATASGQVTCAERNGERSIAIWKTGVTL